MEFRVGELNTTIRMTDSSSMLTPAVLERIVREVLVRVREEMDHDRRSQSERQLRPRASAEQGASWE